MTQKPASLFDWNIVSPAIGDAFKKLNLRRARKDTIARRLRNGREEKVPAPSLQRGDLVVCEAGDIIPADGDVVEGIASVDEAAITGESAPVIRESGGDRSAVTGGTRVI